MTCDPSYYKHTQRLFLMLYEKGLAYQADATVNWDPVDRTVLANEQVDVNGFSWRSGAKVEQIQLKQWFLKITEYAEALYNDLAILSQSNHWPERVIAMQKNWLGPSMGTLITFEIETDDPTVVNPNHRHIEVFTTRADTLFGVRYLALSLNHPVVLATADKDPQLRAFIDSASSLSQDSKTGYLLKGIRSYNPARYLRDLPAFPGQQHRKYLYQPLRVFAAPYVVDTYGTGAVMGVPAHDIRDHAFWRQNVGNELIPSVIAQYEAADTVPPIAKVRFLAPGNNDKPFVEKGILNALCGPYAGMKSDEAIQGLPSRITSAKSTVSWRLRDWLISRQRYWGAPIPIIHCNSCGAVPVPVEDLPVELPSLEPGQFYGRSGNALEHMSDWVNVECPKCHSPAKRETDTMDTFMDSSWYFFRFIDPNNPNQLVSKERGNRFMPVDYYVGGVEHAILHLLYARFITKFLADSELWDAHGPAEPFKKLITQGMVHGKTYSDPSTGRFLSPEEVDFSEPQTPKIRATGIRPHVSFEKMSKSKYNGVDPAGCISKYGADATRAHILFQAPESEVLEWDEERIVGITRWLAKTWRVAHTANRICPPGKLREKWTRKTEEDYDRLEKELLLATKDAIESVTAKLSAAEGFNTVVSDLIKLTNSLEDAPVAAPYDRSSLEEANRVHPSIFFFCTEALLRMMAPLTPAFAEEVWEMLHQDGKRHFTDIESVYTTGKSSIMDSDWPDPKAIADASVGSRSQVVIVQVNGRRKFESAIPTPQPGFLVKGREKELQQYVLDQVFKRTSEGTKFLADPQNAGIMDNSKTIIVAAQGKIINFVLPKVNKG